MKRKKPDLALIGIAVSLSIFGLFMVYNASAVSAWRDFSDKYFFLKDQGKWIVLGLVLMFLTSIFDYHYFYKLALPFLLLTIFLLLLVFIPGLGIRAYGAYRWLNFRIFVVQPAELAKLSLIIYLSAWLSFREKGRLLAFLILIGMLTGLIVIEPDMGTAIILGLTALFLYFASGAPLYHFLLLIHLGFASGLILAKIQPYRMNRLLTFFNPNFDPLGASYHIRQILIALGSGGLWGLGFGKSRQKYEYLPEATTDSIFAIIGEELGFIGCFVLISVFLFLIYRGIKIARNAPDKFGKLLAVGISSWIGIQSLVNLSTQVALFPLTGVPLPFISYGGSALVVELTAIGILLNISKQSKGK